MKWDEADANREQRKAENRKLIQESDPDAFQFIETVIGEFGGRLEWFKCGEVMLGRGAYEQSIRAAQRRKERIEKWKRSGRKPAGWPPNTESQPKPHTKGYAKAKRYQRHSGAGQARKKG